MIHNDYELDQDDVVDVKIVRRSGNAALVEWLKGDSLKRVTIPLSKIAVSDPKGKMGSTEKSILEIGIPYGVPWEEVIGEIKVTPEIIADSLRKHGIWTYEDAQANRQTIVGALQAAYGLDMATLIRGARKMKEEEHE